MPEKQQQKTQGEMRSSITPILIAGNDRLTPYIQVFSHQPENVAQRSLGSLFGIFKIDDTSVDSAFIVNFLTSELKKEYYGNPRRTPAGSFEAGLNRINIALSELAKQGNIAWIGKLESSVCALEKNGMLHFSVTGRSRIALCRENSLTFISDGLAPDPNASNPLKTFIEISSGKLHPNDRILLSTHELFDFLPKEKIESSARHFGYQEFTRFIRTALINEFDFCGAVTVTLEKIILPKKPKGEKDSSVSPESIPNMWGALPPRSAAKNASKKNTPIKRTNESPERKERDGHLYIRQQPSSSLNLPRQEYKENLSLLREHFANALDTFFAAIGIALRQRQRAITKKLFSPKTLKETVPKTDTRHNQEPSKEYPPSSEKPEKKDSSQSQKKDTKNVKKKVFDLPNVFPEKVSPSSEKNIFPKKLSPKSETPFPSPIKRFYANDFLQKTRLAGKRSFSFFQYLLSSFQIFTRKIETLSLHIFQKFQNLPKTWKKGLLGIGLIAAIIAGYSFLTNQNETPSKTSSKETPSFQQPDSNSRENIFSKEKNISFVEETVLSSLFLAQNAIRYASATGKDTLFILENQTAYIYVKDKPVETIPFPDTIDPMVSATYMRDLNLFFILTETGSVVSLSPLSKKFSSTNLSFPEKKSVLLGSYLTYLYVADIEANSILRYPRSEGEGGFGSPLVWLPSESGTSLKESTQMIVNESIYLLAPQNILRFSKRKEDPLQLVFPMLPWQFQSFALQEKEQLLFVLDSKNARILAYSLQGELQKQYILPESLSNVEYVFVSEEDPSSLFLVTEKEVKRMSL